MTYNVIDHKQMKKTGFKMQLKPECSEEYRERHEILWPGLDEGIQENIRSLYQILSGHPFLSRIMVRFM
jgi:L-rhamnose mutarotase